MSKWIDRKFDFDFPAILAPELLERLRGTPARLEDRIADLSREVLVKRDGDKWSIQEHAGHLMDAEELFLGRLDDYDAVKHTLRAAEMSGSKTYESNHNMSDLGSIRTGFRMVRMNLVSRLEKLEPDGFIRSAQHPRLETPMRVCDMIFFEAEHDDYHLAKISRLIRLFGNLD